MKLRIAAAAILTFGTPSLTRADAGLSYAQLTNCAAFNLLLTQFYSLGDQAAAHQEDAATSERRSSALTLAASMLSKQDVMIVASDVALQNAEMIKSLDDKEMATKLITDNMAACATLGKAADVALTGS